MSLNRNRVYKVRLVRSGIQGFLGFINENVVCRPVTKRCIFLNIHEFLTGKGIESHHGKSICTAIEVTAIVMNNVSSITDGR